MIKTIKPTRTQVLCGVVLGAVGMSCVSVSGAFAKPIEDELKYLIEQHPKIHEAEKTLEARGSSIKEAAAQFLPTVRATGQIRSEEHTSELQSHHDLVCRLLLENKKQYI